MLAVDSSKSKRLNIMISETLIEWTSQAADARGISVSALVREALEAERKRTQELAIAEAANALAPLYKTDRELTAFTALDAEEFA